MEPSSTAPKAIVGHFYRKSDRRGLLAYSCQMELQSVLSVLTESDARPVYLGEELVIGRDPGACNWHTFEPAISGRHVKIYSISFDADDTTDVKPLVYAADLSRFGTSLNGKLIGKGQSALLSDNDELVLSTRLSLIFRTTALFGLLDAARFLREEPKLPASTLVQQRELQELGHTYEMTDRKLGSGSLGTVYMAVNRQLGRQAACKIIDLTAALGNEMAKRHTMADRDHAGSEKGRWSKEKRTKSRDVLIRKLAREVEILKDIAHPNIISLENVFKSDERLYIFEELIAGGDLFSYLAFKGGCLDEAEGGVILMQLLEAVKYLHARGIVHRDIKPENVLVASLTEGARIVLSDFGSAIVDPVYLDAKAMKRMFSMTGTYEYSAPEIWGGNKVIRKRGYTKAVDMWNVGVVTTVLLTGQRPFSWAQSLEHQSSLPMIDQSRHNEELSQMKKLDEWQSLNGYPKDFVKRLLVLDETVRMTAEQALAHEWFTNDMHRDEYRAVYDRAVSGWRKSMLSASSIESLTPPAPTPRDKARPPKAHKPIESHYKPAHKKILVSLYPRPDHEWTEKSRILREAKRAASGFSQPAPQTPQQSSSQTIAPSKSPSSKLDPGSQIKHQTPPATIDDDARTELSYDETSVPPSSQKRLSPMLDAWRKPASMNGAALSARSSDRLRGSGRLGHRMLERRHRNPDAIDPADEGLCVPKSSPAQLRDTSQGIQETSWSAANRRHSIKLGSAFQTDVNPSTSPKSGIVDGSVTNTESTAPGKEECHGQAFLEAQATSENVGNQSEEPTALESLGLAHGHDGLLKSRLSDTSTPPTKRKAGTENPARAIKTPRKSLVSTKQQTSSKLRASSKRRRLGFDQTDANWPDVLPLIRNESLTAQDRVSKRSKAEHPADLSDSIRTAY